MRLIYITAILFILLGCNNTKKTDFVIPLKTKFDNNQYIYCADCPEPTSLKKDSYQVLEPDNPIPNNPNNNNQQNISNPERRIKPKHIKPKKYQKRKSNLSKCNCKGKY